MRMFQNFSIDRGDIIKCILLTIIFSISFFAYNRAYSPVIETTYNSASVFSHEEKSLELFSGPPQNAASEDQSADITQENTPKLVISFRPEHITIDESLLEKIRQVAESKKIAGKIDPLHLIIDTNRKDPRGQVSGNALILSGKIPSDSENLKVLVHELGHIVDIYYLPLHGDGTDLSNEFYQVSWDDYAVKKKDAVLSDFVSGYALSNKYEDFAESFAFYIFHNDEFKRRAGESEALRRKYDFFRDYIFENQEFLSTNFAVDAIRSYNWDVTKIPVNVKKYLYYMK